MPHQCLKCGKVYPTGSTELLNGCQQCGGKKFFYTELPLSAEERAQLTKKANEDIRGLVRELLLRRGSGSSSVDQLVEESKDGWIQLKIDESKTEKIITEFKTSLSTVVAPPSPIKVFEPPKPPKPLPKLRLRKSPEIKVKLYPEVINIVEPGVYEIDIERLLDRAPVIVHKHGVYLIHLPSLFYLRERVT